MSNFIQTGKGVLVGIGQFMKKTWNKLIEAAKKLPDRLNKLVSKAENKSLEAEQKTIRTKNLVNRQNSTKLKIHRHGSERIYRMKGYTTVAKVNRKRKSEQQQRLLRRILVTIVIVLIVVVLLNLYNPIKNFSEWKRILGINEISELLGGTTTAPTTIATTIDPTATTIPSDTQPGS